MQLFVFSTLVASSLGFYLPGVAPRDYIEGEPVEIKVNKMESIRTQLPYDYYSLDFCKPEKIEFAAENLGEVLSGDDIQTSAYEVSMQVTEACKILCKKSYNKKQLNLFKERIQEEYKVNWIVDNMPAGTKYYVSTTNKDDVDFTDGDRMYTTRYDKGFDLGFMGGDAEPGTKAGVAYVHNHHRIIIMYHEDPASFEGYRIVGFEVEPFSVAHEYDGKYDGKDTKLRTCSSMFPVTRSAPKQAVEAGETKEIVWTYDIRWDLSDIKWASRWDLYLKMTDSQIHWFSILNSILIVLFLSGMVAMILVRTLHRDLSRYNQELEEMTQEEREEETGWKLVHGDVFRPPQRAGLLSVFVGTGVQVYAMSLLTLIFAALGFLSPANRGGLMTALLVIFVFMGFLAGFCATRLYTMFKLTNWKRNAMCTALLFPGIVFGVFFLLNLLVWGQGSTGAVPFGTLLALMALWLGISVPLVLFGAWVGQKKEPFEPPVRVNNIPRVLADDVPWYAHPFTSILLGGLLPFSAVFIEIFFIMSSVWLHQFYYVFGFLAIVFVILVVTCAEITITMIYFQLCNQDYRWWWRSFLTAGSSAFYLFLYSIMYFKRLEITQFVPAVLFFGYMFLACLCFFLLTGTIGYYACFFFVKAIYGALKVD